MSIVCTADLSWPEIIPKSLNSHPVSPTFDIRKCTCTIMVIKHIVVSGNNGVLSAKDHKGFAPR